MSNDPTDRDTSFAPGTLVREKGKPQIMTVKGAAGLASHGTRGTAGGMLRAHQIVCEWRDPKGGMRSKPFLAAALERVHDDPEAGK